MNEIKLYECEHCRTQYSSKNECEACENFHVKKLKITEKLYLARKNDGNPFPNVIIVIDESGRTVRYRRS